MKKINITASDLETFTNAENMLKELPEGVYSQISSVRFNSVGLECTIEDDYSEEQKIFLPSGVTQISHFDNYIGIYCDRFFFKLSGNLVTKKLTYIFLTK